MVDLRRNPIETARTAPVQFAGMAVNTGVAAFCAVEAAGMHSIPLRLSEYAGVAINLALVAMNGALALGKIGLRDRLEMSLQERGWVEERFARTTTAYCSRQAARIACENYGYLAEYEELCQKNAESQMFRWLPHV